MLNNVKKCDAKRDEQEPIEELVIEECEEFGYSALKANDKAWKEELAEREIWDTAINDGLEAD